MRTKAGLVGVVLLIGQGGWLAHAAPVSFEEQLNNLNSPRATLRAEAARALGSSGRHEAVGPLAAGVRDPEVEVRLVVVQALRALRDPAGAAALVTAMGDADRRIRQDAISGLVETYAETERGNPLDRFLRHFSDQPEQIQIAPSARLDPGVVPALARTLRDESRQVRESAALALGVLQGQAAAGDLYTALKDPEATVRAAAVTAIGQLHARDEPGALIGLLADESANVRQRCLQTVARLKLKEAGPALRTMYAEARGRAAALEILDCIGRIGDPGQADLLRELVRGADGEKKRLAIEGLGRVSDPAMLAAFKKDYQTEGNEELRLAYCFALSYLGDSAFLHSIVLSLGSSTLGPRCRDYLLELGPKIAPDLYEYLSDPDAAVRAELCDILAAMGDLAALPRLGEMINDPSARVAKRANSAIVRLRQIQAARQ